MNNKCNNCAKFLTCDRRKCKKNYFCRSGDIRKSKSKARKLKFYTRSGKVLIKTIQAIKKQIKQILGIQERIREEES